MSLPASQIQPMPRATRRHTAIQADAAQSSAMMPSPRGSRSSCRQGRLRDVEHPMDEKRRRQHGAVRASGGTTSRPSGRLAASSRQTAPGSSRPSRAAARVQIGTAARFTATSAAASIASGSCSAASPAAATVPHGCAGCTGRQADAAHAAAGCRHDGRRPPRGWRAGIGLVAGRRHARTGKVSPWKPLLPAFGHRPAAARRVSTPGAPAARPSPWPGSTTPSTTPSSRCSTSCTRPRAWAWPPIRWACPIGCSSSTWRAGRTRARSSCFSTPTISRPRGTATQEEGCLSLPGLRMDVRRPRRWCSTPGRSRASGCSSISMALSPGSNSMKFDHLEGRLFPDRLPEAAALEASRALELMRDGVLGQAVAWRSAADEERTAQLDRLEAERCVA